MKRPFRILIADDDSDDVQLARECFSQNYLPIDLSCVEDGELLMDHLKGMKHISNSKAFPQLILLDLNMPRKNGLEALKELKQDDIFRKIPVVVFSTSSASNDIEKAYQLGANCFIIKPDTVTEWCDKLAKLSRFWIECVKIYV